MRSFLISPPQTESQNAFASFEKKLGCKQSDLDILKYVGLILIDGLRAAEERIMDGIGNLSDLTWIGGSAGDDLKFKETKVFAKGQSHTNAAVLAIIRLDKGFASSRRNRLAKPARS